MLRKTLFSLDTTIKNEKRILGNLQNPRRINQNKK